MTIALAARPPTDLVDAYRSLGVVELSRRERVDRHQVNRWLKAAGVELDGQRRGNLAQRRPCPADFRDTYIRLGTDGCVECYEAHRDTVRRWRDETGRDELREARAAYLRRSSIHSSAKVMVAKPQPETETSRAAAHWLRFPKHGGWIVTRRQRDGMYFVGSMPMTAQQLVAFATKRGWKGGAR